MEPQPSDAESSGQVSRRRPKAAVNRLRRAKRVQRALVISVALVIVFMVVSVIVGISLSESKVSNVFSLDPSVLELELSGASVERGEALATGLLQCVGCHDRDLGGKVVGDTSIGRLVAPNLTRGRGSATRNFEVSDWVRAIRYGLDRDHRGLWIMPSRRLHAIRGTDLADVVAYLQTLAPVDRDLPDSQLGILGRFVHVLGKLDLIAATEIDFEHRPPHERPTDPVKLGAYLATLGDCAGCHGPELRGVRAGQKTEGGDLVDGPFQQWDLAAFTRAMRQGLRPDNQPFSGAMPWPELGKMGDDELHALFAYLRSLPGRL